jgi:hypothetical protein
MKRIPIALGFAFVLIAVIAMCAAPLFAHHGRGATYEQKKEIFLKTVYPSRVFTKLYLKREEE